MDSDQNLEETPEIYKKLAYRCMNVDSNQRPTVNELYDLFLFWHNTIDGSDCK